MRIKSLDVYGKFGYLWLKNVIDVNLNQHCAKCLIGMYNENIDANVTHVENVELPDGIHYLCGVSSPYRWKNNFHLAFMPHKGSNVDVDYNGIHVIIEDAEQLPISFDNLDTSHPFYPKSAYRTCRCWQFAHWFNDNVKLL